MIPKQEVLKKRQRNSFLEDTKEVESKGWLIDILLCIDALGKKEFELSEVYAFEEELQKKYPNNNHIRDKIRQQLQILRDRNFLMFQ